MLWGWWGLAAYLLALAGVLLLLLGHMANKSGYRPGRYFPRISLLLIVRDQEDSIEGVVRDLLLLSGMRACFFDLVVVDDHSNDQTGKILEKLARRDQAFTLFLLNNYPCQTAWELGNQMCKGEVICTLEVPQRIKPRRVGRAVSRILREAGKPLPGKIAG
ncbi:MAG: glycosyltransferase family 2 protein [Bacillota bacterium]